MAIDHLTSKTVKDPVCGMDVVPGTARSWDFLYGGIVYHFCGSECRSRFQADPQKVLVSGPGQPATVLPRPVFRDDKGWWPVLREELKKWRNSVFWR